MYKDYFIKKVRNVTSNIITINNRMKRDSEIPVGYERGSSVDEENLVKAAENPPSKYKDKKGYYLSIRDMFALLNKIYYPNIFYINNDESIEEDEIKMFELMNIYETFSTVDSGDLSNKGTKSYFAVGKREILSNALIDVTKDIYCSILKKLYENLTDDDIKFPIVGAIGASITYVAYYVSGVTKISLIDEICKCLNKIEENTEFENYVSEKVNRDTAAKAASLSLAIVMRAFITSSILSKYVNENSDIAEYHLKKLDDYISTFITPRHLALDFATPFISEAEKLVREFHIDPMFKKYMVEDEEDNKVEDTTDNPEWETTEEADVDVSGKDVSETESDKLREITAPTTESQKKVEIDVDQENMSLTLKDETGRPEFIGNINQDLFNPNEELEKTDITNKEVKKYNASISGAVASVIHMNDNIVKSASSDIFKKMDPNDKTKEFRSDVGKIFKNVGATISKDVSKITLDSIKSGDFLKSTAQSVASQIAQNVSDFKEETGYKDPETNSDEKQYSLNDEPVSEDTYEELASECGGNVTDEDMESQVVYGDGTSQLAYSKGDIVNHEEIPG